MVASFKWCSGSHGELPCLAACTWAVLGKPAAAVPGSFQGPPHPLAPGFSALVVCRHGHLGAGAPGCLQRACHGAGTHEPKALSPWGAATWGFRDPRASPCYGHHWKGLNPPLAVKVLHQIGDWSSPDEVMACQSSGCACSPLKPSGELVAAVWQLPRWGQACLGLVHTSQVSACTQAGAWQVCHDTKRAAPVWGWCLGRDIIPAAC